MKITYKNFGKTPAYNVCQAVMQDFIPTEDKPIPVNKYREPICNSRFTLAPDQTYDVHFPTKHIFSQLEFAQIINNVKRLDFNIQVIYYDTFGNKHITQYSARCKLIFYKGNYIPIFDINEENTYSN